MALLFNHLLLLPPPKPSPISQTLNPHQNHFSTPKTSSPPKSAPTHLPNPSHSPLPRKKLPPFSFPISLSTHVPITLQFALILSPFPSPAAAAAAAAAAEAEFASEKINIEAVLTSIDDFFNKNPFFVAGVTFIWLVVIPLTQEYLKKYKYVSAIDAFRKLRDVPEAQLLDIRKKKSVRFMASPNLRILGKDVVHVEFSEGDEDGFVKEVLKNYGDPQNTVICVLDK